MSIFLETKVLNSLKPRNQLLKMVNGPHVKSALPANQWTCSRGPNGGKQGIPIVTL